MNIDFGISTLAYYQKPIEKLLPHLVKEKINNIEIRLKENHFLPQEVNELLKLKKLLNQKRITVKAIHMPMNGIDISHPKNYERIKSVREVEKTVLMAFHLGVELIVVHPGAMVNNFEDKKNRLRLSMESLEEIMDFNQNWNIKIALENTLPGSVGDKWEEIQQILQNISSKNLGICFDTGHYLLNYPEIEKGKLNLDKMGINWQDSLWHIHLHDNDGKRDLHLLPQEGLFPWDSLISFLKTIDYKGILIFESKEQNNLNDYLSRVNIAWNNIPNLT